MTTDELEQYAPAGGWHEPPRPLFPLPQPVARGPKSRDTGLEAERQRYLHLVIDERDAVTP